MMDQEELDIELIEGYFNKTLTEAEKDRFDERVKADADFAEKVDDYKEIIRGIRTKAEKDFKEDVASWEGELKREDRITKHIPWKTYLAIAAAILLLLVARIFIFTPDQPKTDQELFTTYFVPYEDVISVRDGSNGKSSLTTAMTFYNDGNYQEAVANLKAVLSDDPDNSEARFYLGASWLALMNGKEAIPVLQDVISQKNNYHDQAEWYLALAYLINQDDKDAMHLLERISNERSHTFHDKAKELKMELAE